MFGRLDGKTALVTGAGRGIGRGIAKCFADAGARVAIVTRGAESGEQAVAAIRSSDKHAELVVADLASRAACFKAVEQATALLGRIDVLVHNAGIFPIDRLADLTEQRLDEVLAVNLKAAFHLSQAVLPQMEQAGWGRLLFTSSVTGPRVTMPGFSAYAASKAGLNGFIRTVALEYAHKNITANGIEPGLIQTAAMDIFGDAAAVQAMCALIPTRRLGSVEDIAYAMLFLASNEAGYITGQTLAIDGGSLLPENQSAVAGQLQS